MRSPPTREDDGRARDAARADLVARAQRLQGLGCPPRGLPRPLHLDLAALRADFGDHRHGIRGHRHRREDQRPAEQNRPKPYRKNLDHAQRSPSSGSGGATS